MVGAQAPRMRVPLADGTLVATRDVPQADLILALDVPDLEGATTRRAQERGNRRATPLVPANAKIINVSLDDLLVRAWATDFNKLREADLMIMADTSVFLPELRRPRSRCRCAGAWPPSPTWRPPFLGSTSR